MTDSSVLGQFATPVHVRAVPARPIRPFRVPVPLRPAVQGPAVEAFRQAASDPSHPLDPPVREQLARASSHDFAHVRVHTGEASRAAVESIGARAYTMGRDIYLGAEAANSSRRERNALLSHEAIHSVQQGMRQVQPSADLPISDPADPAEREAERIGKAVAASNPAEQGSPSLALRDQMRTTYPRAQIATPVSPRIQRDLTGKKAVKDGTFDLNLKKESHPGGSSGMSGTIEFTPAKDAPDSALIKLLQVVRNEDLTTKKEYVWTGGEAPRNTMQTATEKGVAPGYFVDHLAAAATPRSAKADAPVSPYYRTYAPNATVSHDGKKKGASITSASLWDFPSSAGERRFSFETAAQGTDTGYHYATLTWGFTTSDHAKGTVEKEHADAHRAPSATFHAAVKQFNKAYKNPGSSTAP